MAKLRVSREACAELDATDSITQHFWLLNRYPNIGRRRDDLRAGLRSFSAGEYTIVYRVEKSTVDVLHIFHGSRDIGGLL